MHIDKNNHVDLLHTNQENESLDDSHLVDFNKLVSIGAIVQVLSVELH